MTAATAAGFTRPPLTCTVKLEDGEDYTVKLSYGLFNDLQRTVPDPAAVIDTVLSDPYTRDYIVRRCMTPIKKMVKDIETELKPVDEIGLDDPDQVDKLLQWVTGHLLYFFATSAGGLKQLSEQFKAAAPSAPSNNGSQS
jgi:hypothetical protein